jgi:hypothetical protein
VARSRAFVAHAAAARHVVRQDPCVPVQQSTNYAEPSIADYDERRGPLLEYWKSQNGRQSGDPTKLARALITIASQDPPPRRFIAGADAIATAEQKITDLKTQIDANRVLSTSLAFDEERPRA